MNAHRIETIVGNDKTVILKDLPFDEGKEVEVIVLEKKIISDSQNKYSLQGTLIKYDAPFEPVAEEDWEAVK